MEETDEGAQIVLERLRTMPRTVRLNLGNYGSFTRDELIQAVSNKTKIGELVVEMHMAYIRSFKERVNK